jgi:hypothetical protein
MKQTKYTFAVLSLLILAVLIVHICHYQFLVDDAFISFRYADNIASGHGAVFNVGEKVEGYTNFLWVVILSMFSFIGLQPHHIASILSISCSITLFLCLIYFNNRLFAQKRYDLFLLIAPLFLALNRTYAVWSTGGLETRLFSLFVFLAVIFLARRDSTGAKHLRLSALFFALASLTRPEGILLFGSFFGIYLISHMKNAAKVRDTGKSSIIYFIIVASHFIFRLIYYGYPFPNTFYAKVTGAWFDAGLQYLFLFVHEHGLYLLLPLGILLLSKGYDRERRRLLIHISVPLVPYLIYLAYIGGDHFEYRPLDVILPFLVIGIQEGIRAVYDILRRRLTWIAKPAVALLLLLIMFLNAVPGYLSHLDFPDRYDSAVAVRTAESGSKLPAAVPGLGSYLKVLDRTHSRLAANFVCIRQEEHKMALDQVFIPQARLFEKAIEEKYISRDETISLWCVGAIPYFSGLRTVDFLGLTDEHIAHRKLPDIPDKLLPSDKLMGHQKRADWNYLRERKVSYISTTPSKFFFPKDDYFEKDSVIPGKMPPRSYMIPIDDHVFIFRSIYTPGYFEYLLGAKGVEFYFTEKDGMIRHFPGTSK